MKKNLNITKPRYSKQILPVLWPFISLRWGSTVPVFGPSLQKISFVRVYCTSMVATGQEIVRGNKCLQGQGKVVEFHLE